MSWIWLTLRTASRLWRRQPYVIALILICIAAGVGAAGVVMNRAVSTLHGRLPVHQPEELVDIVISTYGGRRMSSRGFYELLQDETVVFEGIAAHRTFRSVIDTPQGGVLVHGQAVSENFFELLGVVPVRGGDLALAREYGPSVVVSERLWSSHFLGDTDILGEVVVVHGNRFRLSGIAPEAFAGLRRADRVRPDIWIELDAADLVGIEDTESPTTEWLNLVGRLQDGKAASLSATPLDRLLPLVLSTRQARQSTVLLLPADRLPPAAVRAAMVLLAVAALTCLMAWLTIVTYGYVSVANRSEEFAARRAIGARWSQLVGQVGVEIGILIGLGSLVGYGVGRLVSERLGSWEAHLSSVSGTVFGMVVPDWCIVATIAAGVVLSTMAISSRRLLASDSSLLRGQGSSGGYGVGGRLLSMGVLAPQISGSVLLVSVAIVAVGGARREAEKDVGYGSNTAAMLSVDLGLHGIDEDTGRVIYEELVASARGVADGGFAGLSTWPPVGESEGFIGVRPISPLAPRGTVAARGYFVDSGVMEAVGMKLVSGRFLGRGAGLDSLAVVLDRPTAERYWPGGRAVGQRVEVDRESGGTEVLTVVGIVEAVLTAGRGENRRDHIFMPWGREYSAAVTLHVDGRPGGGALLRRVRDAVSRSQPGLVAVEAATVAEHAGRQLAEAALGAWAMTIVAVLGVIVGVGGAGGLVGLATVRRGREIAVRLALGQSRGGLVVALARPVLAAVVVGAGAGLALAMTWAGAVGAWLEGAPTFSSAATAVSGGIVAVAGLGASLLPALRATKMESVAGLWKV